MKSCNAAQNRAFTTMNDHQTLQRAMLDLAETRGSAKTICPSEVARCVGGPDKTVWRPLMDPIRQIAVKLAKRGQIDIKQGGKIADPDNFHGIYRIAIKKR